ncbi:HAMP domain-containing histidine kinase [Rhodococcus sp. HM1]|uniref:sensor histidine kinase n=1 Tax=unclassified Rhodococcus (in: high G+C Gram-positive bacteria) TaxID=192944 RepID=UPI0018CFE5AD|nr:MULTISPECIES: HAMP domain-containing sensor histidine kinase [unclassified Rhodococcus (in: high G+C Gram-positive bacteria)]MBH0118865.1 HAMP domain-containing histidine kinase [Rhodococcus sp. CX]MCK8673505.1 HAMP domain-containing histidine kinase [Rhodococcus sp. HM1]
MPHRFSLRARVAAATALGTTVVVGVLGVLVAIEIDRNNLAQLDRRLDTAAQVLVANAGTAGLFLPALGDAGAFAVTIRAEKDGHVRSSTPTQLPELDLGAHTVTVGDVPYRAVTAPVEATRGRLSVAVPYAEAQDVTTAQHRQLAVAGLCAIAVATGLGWVFGGRAVRPLVDLTGRIAFRDPDLAPRRSGVREADELAAAAGAMLADVAYAQAATDAALATARDFAAAAAHELRTPLTAMRTDLEVLSTHDLAAADRTEILGDLVRTQGRVESTLDDLERLARGDLSSTDDFVDTDPVEICDAAAAEARGRYPGLTVEVDGEPGRLVPALPGGLRLVVDNAIANAVRHGGARHVRLTVTPDGPDTVLTVDDDGTGVPAEEREVVFERFRRGTGASRTGSGLGLTLVAQQAALHGGTARLEDSPLGGARLTVRIANPQG